MTTREVRIERALRRQRRRDRAATLQRIITADTRRQIREVA